MTELKINKINNMTLKLRLITRIKRASLWVSPAFSFLLGLVVILSFYLLALAQFYVEK